MDAEERDKELKKKEEKKNKRNKGNNGCKMLQNDEVLLCTVYKKQPLF